MTTVKVNARNNAHSQYSGYPFVSFCTFMGRPLGAGPDGIFTLDGGDKDVYTVDTDERRIEAWFELPTSQLGIDYAKQGRRLYIGGEFNGPMQVEVTTANGSSEDTLTYNVEPKNKSLLKHTIQVPLSSKQRAEHWSITLKNVRGADFSIDFVDGVFIKVARRLGL